MKKQVVWIAFIALLLTNCKDNAGNSPEEQMYNSPMEMVPDMIRGINIGNTLEPPLEGDWNNGPLKEYFFDDYKAEGFTTIRIPVRWDEHTSLTTPFAVDEAWMDRVEQVVDWGLERDLFIILNAHHEDWIKADFSATNQQRFNEIWVQIAERFKDKSQKLLFEIINEPIGLTKVQVDQLNANTLATIRQTNPTRVVIYSGNDYSGLDYMINAAIPNDPNLMAYFHMYDPWDFAGLGNGTWGTASDRETIDARFALAADFMESKDIPVMISEFGAVTSNDYNSRMRHYFTYVEAAIKHNIMFQVWDDGGQFGVYYREERAWPEVKDILMHTFPDSPTNVQVHKLVGKISISWTNRFEGSYKILVQRRLPDRTFQTIAELEQGENSYNDENADGSKSYDYRIIAEIADESDRYSYPVRVE